LGPPTQTQQRPHWAVFFHSRRKSVLWLVQVLACVEFWGVYPDVDGQGEVDQSQQGSNWKPHDVNDSIDHSPEAGDLFFPFEFCLPDYLLSIGKSRQLGKLKAGQTGPCIERLYHAVGWNTAAVSRTLLAG